MLFIRNIVERWRTRRQRNPDQPLQYAAIELEPNVLPPVPPENLLLKHHAMLLDAERMVDLEFVDWERLAKPLLQTVAGYYHLLPASEAHHHCTPGGLLEHSLQTAMYTMRASATVLFESGGAPSSRRENEKRWRLATFVAALLHDCAKPLSDVHVTAPDGELRWNPLRQGLWEWLQEHHLPGYCVTFRRARHANHELRAFEVMHRLLPVELREWLLEAPNQDIYRVMLGAITGSRQDTVIQRLVSKGDSQSTDLDLRENAMNRLKVASVAVPALSSTLTIMRGLVADGSWTFNAPGSRLFLVRHATGQRLYLIWNKAAEQVIEQLRIRRIVGVDRNAEAILAVLADARVIVPRSFTDGRPTTWLHAVAPDPVTASLGRMQPMSAVQIADPRYLLGEMPLPTPVGALVNDELESHDPASVTVNGGHPESTPDTDIYVPRRVDGSALLCRGCHNALRLVRFSHAAWSCVSCGCFYDNGQLFDVTGEHPPAASPALLEEAQRDLDAFMQSVREIAPSTVGPTEAVSQVHSAQPVPGREPMATTTAPASNIVKFPAPAGSTSSVPASVQAATSVPQQAAGAVPNVPPLSEVREGEGAKAEVATPWTTEYGEVFFDVIEPPKELVASAAPAADRTGSPPPGATAPEDSGENAEPTKAGESREPSAFEQWGAGGKVIETMLADIAAGVCTIEDLFVSADNTLFVVLGALRSYGDVIASADLPAPKAIDVLKVLVDSAVVSSRTVRTVGNESGYPISDSVNQVIMLRLSAPIAVAAGPQTGRDTEHALEPASTAEAQLSGSPAPAPDRSAQTATEPDEALPVVQTPSTSEDDSQPVIEKAAQPVAKPSPAEDEIDPDLMPWPDVAAVLAKESTAAAVDRIVGMIQLGDQRIPGGVRLNGKERLLRRSGLQQITEQLPRIRNLLLVRIGKSKDIVVEEDVA